MAYVKLKNLFEEQSLLNDINGILNWDMATYMPQNSRNQRVRQIQKILDNKKSIFDQIKNTDIYIFSHRHQQHYLSAYMIYLDNKIIGIGPKNFRNICKQEKYLTNKYSCTTHPHNTFAQFLSETGIIGFTFFISF